MAVTDVNVIDGIAFDDDNKTLIMEIYDHLHFCLLYTSPSPRD